jgi:hypothetical protein
MLPINLNSKSKVVRMDMFILVILIIVIGFSFTLVGGITPGENFKLTSSPDSEIYTPSGLSEHVATGSGLQLNLVKLKSCSSTVAVNFLVDNSGSMGFDGGKKLKNLKNAVLSFKSKLADDNVFGLQSFSQDWELLINPDKFKNVKSKIHQTVCGLRSETSTYTRDAFSKTETVLDEAIMKYPDYKFALIFISDGVPETGNGDPPYPSCLSSEFCSGNPNGISDCRCFSKDQDPTNFYNSTLTDMTKRIKDKGVKIFSIAFVDKSDEKLNNILESLLKRIASSEDTYYRAPNEEDIKIILDKIATKICQESN